MLFLNYLVEVFGYENAVFVKDLFLMITSALYGILLVLLLFSKIITRVESGKKFDHFIVMNLEHSGKKYIGISPKTIAEGLDAIVSILFVYFYRNRPYKLKNRERSQVLITIVIIITILATALSFYLVTHMIPPPKP